MAEAIKELSKAIAELGKVCEETGKQFKDNMMYFRHYKRNDLARASARYDLMNLIAHRKNCWNPKPSKCKSRVMQKWEDEIQALIDGEYIHDGYEE